MQAVPSIFLHNLANSWEPPLQKTKFAEVFSDRATTRTSEGGTEVRNGSASRDGVAINASWRRLLDRLEDEVRVVAEGSPDIIIPSIDFKDIRYVKPLNFILPLGLFSRLESGYHGLSLRGVKALVGPLTDGVLCLHVFILYHPHQKGLHGVLDKRKSC